MLWEWYLTTFCIYPDFSEANLFEQFKDVLLNAGYFDELTMPYTDHLEKAKIAFKGVLKVCLELGTVLQSEHVFLVKGSLS